MNMHDIYFVFFKGGSIKVLPFKEGAEQFKKLILDMEELIPNCGDTNNLRRKRKEDE